MRPSVFAYRGQRVRRLLSLDIRLGARWWGMGAIALVGVSAAQLMLAYRRAAILDIDTSGFTLGDNLGLILAGSPPFEYRPGLVFVPPAGWLLLCVIALYVSLIYPCRDAYVLLQNVLSRVGHRWIWLLSKIAWLFLTVGMYGLCMCAVATVWTVAHGQPVDMGLTTGACLALPLFSERMIGDELTVSGFIVQALLALSAMTFAQFALSLVARPAYALMAMVMYLIAGAYVDAPVFLGNATMLARWSRLSLDGVDSLGLEINALIVLALGILASFLIFQNMSFESKDLMT